VPKLNLFGVGTFSSSRAITAQRRINCYVELRKENEKTSYAVLGRPGLNAFVTTLGVNPTRGMWAVNTLTTPLLFVVQGNRLTSITNSGVTSTIGTLSTSSGDVSMVDDGTYLMIVDGTKGYWYNMVTPGALTIITDGNFTTSPGTVTWQDTYFIVTSNLTNQFQLSSNGTPVTWPAVNINFTGTAPGSLQAGIADHSVLFLFGDVYTEFWQDAGNPDFPYALIPGSAQEFGLVAPASLAKFDNSLMGLFQNKMGGRNVSRMSGFNLTKVSDTDIDYLLSSYTSVADARGYGFMIGGHPLYVLNIPSSNICFVYDGLSNIWTEWQDYQGNIFWGDKFAQFVNRLVVSDVRNGNVYEMTLNTYSDNTQLIPIELTSRHVWNEDHYIGISRLQVDFQSGVGLVSGQGEIPVVDLQVSKDGGNTFYSVGYSSLGKLGEYTQRVIWNTLGAARDWVFKLRLTDPVKTVITGANVEITEVPM
jgi:hypothetical protein